MHTHTRWLFFDFPVFGVYQKGVQRVRILPVKLKKFCKTACDDRRWTHPFIHSLTPYEVSIWPEVGGIWPEVGGKPFQSFCNADINIGYNETILLK